MPSRAQEFFHQITAHADPAQFLAAMVASQKCETEFLEFKGAGQISETEIKKYWSKALSGFANTEGGVLVWGIRASKVPSLDDPSRKIDGATDLDLAPVPSSLAQHLKDTLLEALIEPVRGVEIEAVGSSGGSGAGFVICLIPEGDHKPYRAQLEPSRQYWQRVGDNFVVIPHSLLRSLFYPRTSPDLRIDIVCIAKSELTGARQPHAGPLEARYDFRGYLSNVGTRSAREIVLHVETNYPSTIGAIDLFATPSPRGNTKQFVASRTIHPMEERILCLACNVTAHLFLDMPALAASKIKLLDRIVFTISIFCDDAAPVHRTIEFDSKAIQEATK